MKHVSVAGQLVHSAFDESDKDRPAAGAFSYDKNEEGAIQALIYVCPCGCRMLRAIPVATGEKQKRAWQWDGNLERPTIRPSIRHLDHCRWHGFLEQGQWNPCGDSGA